MFRFCVFVLVVWAWVATASAQSFDARFNFGAASQSQTNVATTALQDRDGDGRCDGLDLFDAALTAGGTTDPQRRATYRQALDRIVDELRLSGRVVGSDFDKARAVHEWLHARLLTGGFRETATTLEAAFDAGRFNCISSVILFRIVAERFGLQVHGVEVPGHAYAVVETSTGAVVVQTTCPAWFTVLDNQQERRAALERTLGRQVAADADLDPAAGRRLNDVGLAAVVIYNRGLDHLEAGRYADALAANRTALELDSHNTTARTNLLATVNNWSLAEFKSGRVATALQLLEQGLAVAPDYELFHENLIAVYQQTLARSTATSQSAQHRVALQNCYVRWHDTLVNRGEAAAAERVANRAQRDPFLNAAP